MVPTTAIPTIPTPNAAAIAIHADDDDDEPMTDIHAIGGTVGRVAAGRLSGGSAGRKERTGLLVDPAMRASVAVARCPGRSTGERTQS